jgi:mono/diheme cytochrome c family protein
MTPKRAICAMALAAGLAAAGLSAAAYADDAQVARGKYLVNVIGCNDCHTPGALLGKPDMAKFLGGSDVAFMVPGLGAFLGPNLTPDDATGLGKWTPEQIVTAFTTGKTPDGRILAPVMPYQNFANMTPADAQAVALYLKSLPPISHQVPGPFGPNEKVTTLVYTVVPGAGMPQPPGGSMAPGGNMAPGGSMAPAPAN